MPEEPLQAFVAGPALATWSTTGIDAATGTFVERIDLDGTPELDAPRRLRVQARQIYTFAHASVLGLIDGRALVERAFARMAEDAWHADGGWVFAMDRNGHVVESVRRSYEAAFVLLACAWTYRLTGDNHYRDWADRTLAFLDERLRDADGGYRSCLDTDEVQSQNQHMHLFEACIGLHQATGAGKYLDRAAGILALFERRMFDPAIGAVREFFTDDWQHAPGHMGERIDAGHQFEWCWLLAQYRKFRPGGADYPARLLQFGEQLGTHPDTGFVMDEVGPTGVFIKPTQRLWPQTEVVKAQLARFEAGAADGREKALLAAGHLHDVYLIPATGLWHDVVDIDGRAIAAPAPASTLYHLFVAAAELGRLVGGPMAPPSTGD